jgi:hypothetical protein
LRLLYLKHRYQLGYETLCHEVSDSLTWRRFCRIPLTSPVPHPTTLAKLVGRSGPQTIEQLNAALVHIFSVAQQPGTRKILDHLGATDDRPAGTPLHERTCSSVGQGGLQVLHDLRRPHGRYLF